MFAGLTTAACVAAFGVLGAVIRWGIHIERSLQAQALINAGAVAALNAILVRLGHVEDTVAFSRAKS